MLLLQQLLFQFWVILGFRVCMSSKIQTLIQIIDRHRQAQLFVMWILKFHKFWVYKRFKSITLQKVKVWIFSHFYPKSELLKYSYFNNILGKIFIFPKINIPFIWQLSYWPLYCIYLGFWGSWARGDGADQLFSEAHFLLVTNNAIVANWILSNFQAGPLKEIFLRKDLWRL